MELLKAISERRSIRSFRPDPLPERDLKTMLEAACMAPSAGNCQPWEFVIVRSEKGKEALADAAYGQYFLTEAPVVVVVCANLERSASRYGGRGEQMYCLQDTAAAIQNLLLTAHSLGYGTCWIGAFDDEAVARAIRAPRGIRPVAIIPIGKPAERPRAPERIPLERLCHEEHL